MGECGVIHGCVLLASYLMCVHISVCARECTYTRGQARRLEVDTSVFLNHFLFVFFERLCLTKPGSQQFG